MEKLLCDYLYNQSYYSYFKSVSNVSLEGDKILFTVHREYNADLKNESVNMLDILAYIYESKIEPY